MVFSQSCYYAKLIAGIRLISLRTLITFLLVIIAHVYYNLLNASLLYAPWAINLRAFVMNWMKKTIHMTQLCPITVSDPGKTSESHAHGLLIFEISFPDTRCAIVTRLVRHRGCYDWMLRSSADQRKSRAAGRIRKRFSHSHLDVSRSSDASRISLSAHWLTRG